MDLVIFDCDGVLIDSEIISARMLIAELRGYGVDITIDYVKQHFLGRSYPMVMRQIRDQFALVLPERFESDYRARLLRAFDTELRAMPGVDAVMAALACPFCVATSSSPERVRHSLGLVGLWDRCAGRIFTASQVAHGKPAPDLFLFAAAEMGAAPNRCLVIEDSQNGMQAALAAGMTVSRFTGGSHLSGPGPIDDGPALPHHSFADFTRFFDDWPQLRRENGRNPE
ncbi:MAG: HAD family hydrolase [Rhodobacteraceae bacterium]|nr:HAD family hydrolase [Paracoccaceae bacterium]